MLVPLFGILAAVVAVILVEEQSQNRYFVNLLAVCKTETQFIHNVASSVEVLWVCLAGVVVVQLMLFVYFVYLVCKTRIDTTKRLQEMTEANWARMATMAGNQRVSELECTVLDLDRRIEMAEARIDALIKTAGANSGLIDVIRNFIRSEFGDEALVTLTPHCTGTPPATAARD